MKKIMDTVPLDILAFSKGFLYVKKESNFRRDARPVFFAYDVESRAFSAVTKSVYLLNKFGASYKPVAGQLADRVSCAAGILPGGRPVVIYPSGEMGIFEANGELGWTGDLVYHNAAAKGLAVEGKCFWSAVPQADSIIKYSPVLSRVIFRIGSEGTATFSSPEAVIRYGNLLYVCSTGSCKIRTVELESFNVRDYRLFNEPVFQYLRTNGKEIVVLQSGTYQL